MLKRRFYCEYRFFILNAALSNVFGRFIMCYVFNHVIYNLSYHKCLPVFDFNCFFNHFRNDTCKHCKTKHQKRPTTLPCLDTICALCYEDALQNELIKCPVCDQTFNINFTPPASDKRSDH